MEIDQLSITIGWREALIGLIVIVAAYMVVVLLRMRRLRRAAALAGGEAPAGRPAPEEPPPGGESRWHEAQAHLVQEAFMRGVEDELAQLRDEVDALRGELAALREDFHHEVGHMRAGQPVSPIYNDAMQMAQLGHDAVTIAERCGIARAEAELVVSLVKSQNK